METGACARACVRALVGRFSQLELGLLHCGRRPEETAMPLPWEMGPQSHAVFESLRSCILLYSFVFHLSFIAVLCIQYVQVTRTPVTCVHTEASHLLINGGELCVGTEGHGPTSFGKETGGGACGEKSLLGPYTFYV